MSADWIMVISYLVITILGWVGGGGCIVWRMSKLVLKISENETRSKTNRDELLSLSKSVTEIRAKTIDNGLCDDIKRIEAGITGLRIDASEGFKRVHQRIDENNRDINERIDKIIQAQR